MKYGKIKTESPKTELRHAPEHSDTARFPFYRMLGKEFLLPFMTLILLDVLMVLPLVQNHVLTLGVGVFLVILPKLIVVPWAGRRTLRLAEMHYQRHGSSEVKLAVLGALLAMVLITLIASVEAVQSMIFTQHEQEQVWTAPSVKYQFGFQESSGLYTIEGEIDFGISRDFRKFLTQNPDGKVLNLDSSGGSIYEGRGLHRIVSDLGLDTHVENQCLSSCALAFLGGRKRTLSADARLGFHQYAVDYSRLKQHIPFYDPEEEQAHDIALMREVGISESFLKRVFDQPHEAMWIPPHALLEEAGVIHP